MSRGLPERIEAMSTWALNLGFQEIGEYEEVLEVSLRGIEQARKTQNVFLLFSNLDRLGRAYEVLLDLREARRVNEEALELRGAQGPQYEVFSSIRLCGVAVLSGDWEEAYSRAKKAIRAHFHAAVQFGAQIDDRGRMHIAHVERRSSRQ